MEADQKLLGSDSGSPEASLSRSEMSCPSSLETIAETPQSAIPSSCVGPGGAPGDGTARIPQRAQYPHSEPPVIPHYHWDRDGNPCSRPSWGPCRGPGQAGGAAGSGRMIGNHPGYSKALVPSGTRRGWTRLESRYMGGAESEKAWFAAVVTLRHQKSYRSAGKNTRNRSI